MEQFYYQGTAVVENADADCHSLLKASALLRYVEQISSMHARKFGMDDKFFEDHGVAFLVGKHGFNIGDVTCPNLVRMGRNYSLNQVWIFAVIMVAGKKKI